MRDRHPGRGVNLSLRTILAVGAVAAAAGLTGCGVRSRLVAERSNGVRDQLTDLGVTPVDGSSAGCENVYQPGEALHVYGYDFKAGTAVRVFVSYQGRGTVSHQVASLTADSTGAIGATIRIPLAARGFVRRERGSAGLIFFEAIGLGADGVSHADATQMAGLVPRGRLCAPLHGHPVAQGDPGNRRLDQLAADPIFHRPPRAATTPRLTLTPARFQEDDFGAGGWSGPAVALTFSSSASPRSVYQQIAEEARSDGWRPVNISRFGSPESWYKTYPNGASATLGILWPDRDNSTSGPIEYQLAGSISLPGQNWSRFFAKPAPSAHRRADPGNKRLNQLASEAVFHALPPDVSSHKLTLIPAWFVRGGAQAPDVTLDFKSAATRAAVLEYYEHRAGADGWQLISADPRHVADLWHKTYTDGAEAILVVTWIPPLHHESGPNEYAVVGSISLPGQKLWFSTSRPTLIGSPAPTTRAGG